MLREFPALHCSAAIAVAAAIAAAPLAGCGVRGPLKLPPALPSAPAAAAPEEPGVAPAPPPPARKP